MATSPTIGTIPVPYTSEQQDIFALVRQLAEQAAQLRAHLNEFEALNGGTVGVLLGTVLRISSLPILGSYLGPIIGSLIGPVAVVDTLLHIIAVEHRELERLIRRASQLEEHFVRDHEQRQLLRQALSDAEDVYSLTKPVLRANRRLLRSVF